MITLQDLSYKIGTAQILSGVTAHLNPGQVTAIIGPNGAGKSTLLDLIARQSSVQSGQVLLEGNDISRLRPQDLALRLALVSQQTGVASRIRIRDLVDFGRWPHHQGRPQAEDSAKTAEALSRFELDDLADRFLDEVSGGQRQRAFVAMAYCQDTDWLLLDEPLNNLDLRHATRLMRHLKSLSQDEQKGIVIVIHDLNYAINYAEHVIALKSGKVAFSGPTQDVATSCNLTNLFDTMVDVTATPKGVFVHHHILD